MPTSCFCLYPRFWLPFICPLAKLTSSLALWPLTDCQSRCWLSWIHTSFPLFFPWVYSHSCNYLHCSTLVDSCSIHLRNILPLVFIFIHVSHMLQAAAQHNYVLALLATPFTFPDHPPYRTLFRITLLNSPEKWRQEAPPKAVYLYPRKQLLITKS